MKILSCDPGIKNLSYCYLNINDPNNVKSKPTIIKWDTLCVIDNNENCSKMLIDEIVDSILVSLNENFDDKFEADIVLIENQPMHLNGIMKTISVVIYTYFNMMRLQYGNIQQVKFISAINKLKCNKGSNIKKETYKDRKKTSIELTKLYIADLFPEKLEWFNKLKKKDDASDSCLQAIYYIEKILNLEL